MKYTRKKFNWQDYFSSEEEWKALQNELEEIDKEMDEGKFYTMEEILEEIYNTTEEDALEFIKNYEDEYERKYGEKYNWNEVKEMIEEEELFTR